MAHEVAKEQAKRFYFRACVFTGQAGVDGAHIFPAGDFIELADFPENIVPAVRPCHRLFDERADGTRRPVSEKIWMLRNLVTIDEMRVRVNKALRMLALRCEAMKRADRHGLHFPEMETPKDEKILRYWQNSEWTGTPVTNGVEAFSEVQSDL